MSTLEIRAARAPRAHLALGGFGRLFSFLLTVIDVFAEAQQEADKAHRRYPFVAW